MDLLPLTTNRRLRAQYNEALRFAEHYADRARRMARDGYMGEGIRFEVADARFYLNEATTIRVIDKWLSSLGEPVAQRKPVVKLKSRQLRNYAKARGLTVEPVRTGNSVAFLVRDAAGRSILLTSQASRWLPLKPIAELGATARHELLAA